MTVGPSNVTFKGASTTYSDIFVININSAGAPQWGTSFGGSANANKAGYAVAVDSAGKSSMQGRAGSKATAARDLSKQSSAQGKQRSPAPPCVVVQHGVARAPVGGVRQPSPNPLLVCRRLLHYWAVQRECHSRH